MSQPYVGQVMMFGGNFAPQGYLMCNGSLQSIANYETLYTLLGTTYGGDGVNTFGLPDLRGRAPVSMGQGPGLSSYPLGQMSGVEAVTVTSGQTPVHTHAAATAGASGPTNTPSPSAVFGDQTGGTGGSEPVYVYAPNAPAAQAALAPGSISTVGGNAPHENRQPYLAINFCIAAFGVYPTQS